MNFMRLLLLFLLVPISISALDNSLDTTKTLLDSLEYTADKIIYNFKIDQIKLIDNSEIYYKKSFIKSDSILIDLRNKIAIAQGASEMFNGEQSIFGSTIFYNIETEEGMLFNGRTKFEDGYYTGATIRKIDDNTFDIDNAKFTTCDVESQYYIFSPKFRVFLNDKIVAKPVILYINYFPILILPFATFPIKQERHSGFLVPEPGYNNKEGKFIKDLAYFQTLGDYGDILLSFDIMELTGYEFRLRSRYLKRYFINGNINSRVLYFREQSLDRYKIRWTINSFHKQIFSQYSQLLVKSDFVSDADVRETSDEKEIRMDKTLHSYIYYTHNKDRKNFNTTLDYRKDLITNDETIFSKLYFSKKADYHSLNIYGDYRVNIYPDKTDKMTLKLPSISFQMYRHSIAKMFDKGEKENSNLMDKIYISYKGNFLHYGNINSDSPTLSELFYKDVNNISQHREGIKHSISLSYDDKIFRVLSFVQSFNYNEIWADKDENNKKLVRGNDYNSKTTMFTELYGIFTFNAGRLKAMRHIITPKISYSMHPDFSKNDRFYSFSPISISTSKRSEKISFSLKNKLQAKVLGNDNKIKKLNNLFTMNSSFSYDNINKPDGKGFSDISHRITIMPFNFEIVKTNFNLSNTFKCNQDFYSLDIENYSLTANLSLKGILNYIDYFPYINSKQEEDKSLSEKESSLDIDKNQEQKPWSISLSYSYINNKKSDYYSSDLHTNLNLNLTKNWSIKYNNYYNFKEKKLISQSVEIYRDLHCWQLKFNWSKSGENWSYRFEVKVPKLPDLRFLHTDSSKPW